ncbi:MAG: aspartate-semialdehyde dehydrogenase [Thermoplasmata archaeon]|nr:aspartate-semialdehyde dehydrogenase [Thermoplasmata archaeon]
MTPRPLPTAILGASGYIGQHFARLLADHPEFGSPRLLSTERSDGKRLGELWHLAEPPPASLEDARLERLSVGQIARAGVRVAFSAVPSGAAGPIETELTRRGVHVFTNAADHRLDAGVPLLLPEVNPDHLALARRRPPGRGILVANPNCSTTGLVLALAPILARLSPRTVHVTTYQALSGAGYPGVPSLAITDNVVPYIEGEEEKIARESSRILGPRVGSRVSPLPIPFIAHCARVGTREGHLEAITLETTARVRRSEIEDLWTEFDPLRGESLPTAPHPTIELRREVDRPQPLRDRWAGHPVRARGMAAVVGRVRWEPPFLRFFVLSHNAVRGGAGGSVLNAEFALARGALDRSAGASR